MEQIEHQSQPQPLPQRPGQSIQPSNIRKPSRSGMVFALYILIFLVICVAIYFIWFTRTESYKCLDRPLIYGVAKISTEQNPVTCTCTMAGNSKQVLSFNKDNITLVDYGNYLP